MEKITGIYQIQSKVKPDRIYIGSAMNIHKRWSSHLCNLRKNIHNNPKLLGHYNKYGESDLQFSVLIGCNKEDLLRHEQFFIDLLKPSFNICSIAGSRQGTIRSLDSKVKVRQSIIRLYQSGHYIENKKTLIENNKNRVWTTEMKVKLGAKMRYKKTEEHKKRLRESVKRYWNNKGRRSKNIA